MTKLIKLLAASIMLLSMTLVGCSSKDKTCGDKNSCTMESCGKTCPDATVRGACTVSHINTDLISLEKYVPTEATLGNPYTVEIIVKAKQHVSNVLVTDTVPPEARFDGSDPGASINGDRLSWRFDTMDQGECRRITYSIVPTETGCLMGCVSVIAVPRSCASTFVGRAILEIEKSCDSCVVEVGCPMSYNIRVRNVGNTAARDVVVTDTLPENVRHVSGEQTLTWDVGCLGPCQEQKFRVNVAASGRGRCKNVATATASNAEKVAATSECTCVQHVVEIVKNGPEKQFIGKVANYSIVVRNPGDSVLTNVVVTDYAPRGTTICSAPGACIRGSQATWTIQELAPGVTETFEIGLCAECIGTLCNSVVVQTCEGVCDEGQVATQWVGHPALLIEAVDECDPLLEGESTCYRVVLCNQGTALDRNVQLRVIFPSQLQPEFACGATRGSISGRTVTFDAVEELCPRQSVEFTVQAKAVSTGDARVRFEMNSDLLRTPVVEEESTQVY